MWKNFFFFLAFRISCRLVLMYYLIDSCHGWWRFYWLLAGSRRTEVLSGLTWQLSWLVTGKFHGHGQHQPHNHQKYLYMNRSVGLHAPELLQHMRIWAWWLCAGGGYEDTTEVQLVTARHNYYSVTQLAVRLHRLNKPSCCVIPLLSIVNFI